MKTRSSRRRALALILFTTAAAAGGPAGALAQGAPPEPGEELSVTWYSDPSGVHTFGSSRTRRLEFVSANPLQFVGRDGNRLYVIDARSIRSVRRRIGTKPASAPAMVFGSVGGFAAGFATGAWLSAVGGGQGGRSPADDGLVAGVLYGAPIGALIAFVASRSRGIYEDIGFGRSRPALSVSPSGSWGLSLSVPIG